MRDKLQLAFPLLQDAGNRLAAEFGVVRTVPEELLEAYRGFGIDLERINGEASGTLPMPARYIVGSDGIIRHTAVNLDHTRRPEPAETVTLLRELQDNSSQSADDTSGRDATGADVTSCQARVSQS